MKPIRIAINGFGRIGRGFCRLVLQEPNIELVAINDLADADTLAHLLKYDSIHGVLGQDVATDNDAILVGSHRIRMFQNKDPELLPWRDLDIDIVIESTGIFRTREGVSAHLRAGAKQVIITAPSSTDDVPTVVLGVNDSILEEDDLSVISNASCTTNCAAPMVKVIEELCGIQQAYITTVHSYTGDQKLHDAPHKDLRRARAGAMSIVPTTTGAAKAVTKIFPHLEGHIGGCGIRVPVPDGSLTDITFVVDKDVTIEEVNAAFEKASKNELKGILSYINDPIVSVDVIGNPYSCVFDSLLTSVLGKMVKVVAWYDNEMGYANRLKDLVLRLKH
ncbi:MAG: glyceraldehyde 3-phosphate dehydrogenase [Candidatus Azotimanducaceae bacterium]|jgi:glyceraldehyde 3-phosphate dehydrogenase